jgi:hypothetical protein
VLQCDERLNIFFRASAPLQRAKGSGSFDLSACDAANNSRFRKTAAGGHGVVIEGFGVMVNSVLIESILGKRARC